MSSELTEKATALALAELRDRPAPVSDRDAYLIALGAAYGELVQRFRETR